MNTNQETDKAVLYRVSRLLEFFSASQLHSFFHACQDCRLDITTSFTLLDELTLRYTAEKGVCPHFGHMVEVFKEKSGAQSFALSPIQTDQPA